ncbi:hypothetical protein JEZ13_10115 [bacterium]|nr:hypothetical protein [bacterium]
MKSYLVLLWALFLFTNTMLAYPIRNSLGEIKAENELAQRIENNLSNFVEKSIVFVDLDLKYNLFNPSSGDLKIDQKLSLPGLPVGKTDSSVPNIDLTDYAPTEITKMRIRVRVPENVGEDLLKELEEVVSNTISIDLLRGDELLITPDLPVVKDSSNSIFNFRNFLILLTLFVIMIIINNIRNSTKIIAKSLRRIKISNLDQLKGTESRDFKMYSNPNSGENHSFISNSGKPLQVKILKDDEAKSDNNLDFLNELSNSNFLSIIKSENPKEIALILTQVEAEKVDYFFKFYDGSIDEVIQHLLNMENILQLDMKIMVVGMYQKYLEALDKNPLKINNVKIMINFINNSSLSVAQKLFDRLKELNPELAQEVQKKIFLIEDILKLKNVQIEQINSEFTHREMVQFLKCVPDEIRQKFFSQLSERAVIILKEDMEIIGEIPDEEAEKIINHSLQKIRYLLNY